MLLAVCPAISTTIRRKPAQDSTGLLNLTPLSTLYQQMQVKQKGLQHTAATAPPLAPLFFEAPQYPVGNSVEAVVSGDFNSDGKVNLAIADYCMDSTSQDTCRQFGSAANVLLGVP